MAPGMIRDLSSIVKTRVMCPCVVRENKLLGRQSPLTALEDGIWQSLRLLLILILFGPILYDRLKEKLMKS